MARKRPEPKTIRGAIARIIADHLIVENDKWGNCTTTLYQSRAAGEILKQFTVIPKSKPCTVELHGVTKNGRKYSHLKPYQIGFMDEVSRAK